MADELVDLTRLTEIFGDDTPSLVNIFTLYIDEGTERMPDLGRAIEARDATKSYKLAHAINGASANVGANRVQGVANSIELKGRACDLSGVDEAYGRLQIEFDATKNFLNDYISTLNAS
jgi:HPt (histidine-containing phosphotransfer) domain-containing protein